MKRQKLFHTFLPGVTVAVLTAYPALAGNVQADGTELDFYLDTNNIRHTTSIESHDQIIARKLYSGNNTSIISSSINWNRIKAKSNKTKTILSKVPRIKQVSVQKPIGIQKNTDLDLANQSFAIDNLNENISHSREKAVNITAIDNQKSLSRTNLNHKLTVHIPTSKPKLVQTGIKQARKTDSKRATSKQELRRNSPDIFNVSQETAWLASSLQINSCRASALLSNSGKCEPANVNTISSVPFSTYFVGKVSEQNQEKIRKPSLANKLQRLKRVGDRKSKIKSSIIGLNNFESSTNIQLAQTTNPQKGTPQNTQPNPQGDTPPATTTPDSVPANDSTTPQSNPNLNLNPNPNPLVFPTKPDEVKIKGTQPITLEQALDLAQRNNRDLQTALLTLKRSRAAVREQQAALFPQLNLTTDLTRSQTSGGQLQNELSGGLRPDLDEPNTNFTGRLELDYRLYTSGARLAAIRRAEEQLKNDELDVERISEEIRLSVNTDYYNLQEADEQVRIQRSAVENSSASLRDAEAQEKAGIGTRFAVLQARSTLANDIQSLNNALSAQKTRRSQLAQRLSLAQSINLTASDPVKLAGLWNKSLEESMVLAFKNRPELQQQLAQRNIGEQNRRSALAQLGPQISLVGTYDILDEFDDSIGVTDGYSLGLQARLNLFDGGTARSQANQAKADIAIAENRFAQVREQIRSEVEQAYAELQSNLQNIETSNLGLEVARESLRLARLRFQAGVGTQTDVINEQTALTRAEGNRVQAILGYNRALATLRRSITVRGLPTSDNANGNVQSDSPNGDER